MSTNAIVRVETVPRMAGSLARSIERSKQTCDKSAPCDNSPRDN